MATIEQQLESFTRFVRDRVDSGDSAMSLDELFDLWRHENPTHESYAENVAAIAASIDDFNQGARGTMAGEHSAQLRREFGLDDK